MLIYTVSMKGISAKGLSSMSPEVHLLRQCLAYCGVLHMIYHTDHVREKAQLTGEVHIGWLQASLPDEIPTPLKSVPKVPPTSAEPRSQGCNLRTWKSDLVSEM